MAIRMEELIPKIKKWIDRPHGDLNFHLTEFLTGHSGFRSYLHRTGRARTSMFTECATIEETPEHVMFECLQFQEDRKKMRRYVKKDTRPEDIIEEMLKN